MQPGHDSCFICRPAKTANYSVIEKLKEITTSANRNKSTTTHVTRVYGRWQTDVQLNILRLTFLIVVMCSAALISHDFSLVETEENLTSYKSNINKAICLKICLAETGRFLLV